MDVDALVFIPIIEGQQVGLTLVNHCNPAYGRLRKYLLNDPLICNFLVGLSHLSTAYGKFANEHHTSHAIASSKLSKIFISKPLFFAVISRNSISLVFSLTNIALFQLLSNSSTAALAEA